MIELVLKHDQDGRWRWYEAGSGADTEVSGSSIRDAYLQAEKAWGKIWRFRFLPELRATIEEPE